MSAINPALLARDVLTACRAFQVMDEEATRLLASAEASFDMPDEALRCAVGTLHSVLRQVASPAKVQEQVTGTLKLVRRVVSYFKSTGNVRGQAYALHALACVHFLKGQFETVLKMTKEATERFQEAEDLYGEARLMCCRP